MQSTTVNNITFSYPDSPCMIFNPVPVKVEGTLSKLRIIVSVGLTSYTVTYDTPNGGIVDIREYAQGLFDGLLMGGDLDYTQQIKVSEMGKTLNVSAFAMDTDGSTLAQCNFSLFAIYGGMRAGERYNRHRTVTWFQNYPFTVGHYAPAGSHVAVGINGAPNTFTTVNSEGIYNVLIDDANGGRYMTIWELIGTLTLSTFEDLFDLTFSYELNGTQEEKVRIRLVTKDIDEGIYLRWIDRHGFWNYWLFKEGSVTRAVGSSGNWYRNNLYDWEEIYHWQKTSGRRQNLTRNDVLPVCAPLVDPETFDMLQDVTTSPCVDMYLGKDENDIPKWTAVTIEAGSYTKEVRRPEQDFIMNIVLPEIPIQKL